MPSGVFKPYVGVSTGDMCWCTIPPTQEILADLDELEMQIIQDLTQLETLKKSLMQEYLG